MLSHCNAYNADISKVPKVKNPNLGFFTSGTKLSKQVSINLTAGERES